MRINDTYIRLEAGERLIGLCVKGFLLIELWLCIKESYTVDDTSDWSVFVWYLYMNFIFIWWYLYLRWELMIHQTGGVWDADWESLSSNFIQLRQTFPEFFLYIETNTITNTSTNTNTVCDINTNTVCERLIANPYSQTSSNSAKLVQNSFYKCKYT